MGMGTGMLPHHSPGPSGGASGWEDELRAPPPEAS